MAVLKLRLQVSGERKGNNFSGTLGDFCIKEKTQSLLHGTFQAVTSIGNLYMHELVHVVLARQSNIRVQSPDRI